jgi:hypothetical protein
MNRLYATALEEVLPVPPSSLAVSISSSAAAADGYSGSRFGSPRAVALDIAVSSQQAADLAEDTVSTSYPNASRVTARLRMLEQRAGF